MTKDRELKVLDDAIAKLGDQSYLGPWLKSVRAEIEMDMRSDMAPVMTVREAHATAKRIIEASETKGQEIRDDARKGADRMLADARGKVEQARASLRVQIARCAEIVDGWR